MSAISSLADAADDLFQKYYEELVPVLKTILKEVNHKDYRVLKGKTIEALTIIGLAVGKERF